MSIYNYFFRFAQVKMQQFVEEPLLMLFTVKYITDTELVRIHSREILSKNDEAYYRAIENMINLTPYKNQCIHLIKEFLPETKYTIEKDQICFKRLESFNQIQ